VHRGEQRQKYLVIWGALGIKTSFHSQCPLRFVTRHFQSLTSGEVSHFCNLAGSTQTGFFGVRDLEIDSAVESKNCFFASLGVE
jgi:hypothetical protein